MNRDGSPPGRAAASPGGAVRFWVFFLLAGLAAFSGAAGHLAARVPSYDAQALIAFFPLGERPVSAAAVELMVPRYVAYATSPFVVRQVAAATHMPATRLQSHLTVSLAATTANVSVTMVSTDPALATDIANRIANLMLERAADDTVLGARSLAAAAVPTSPRGPSRPVLLAGAGFASVLLGLGAGLIGRRTGSRRRQLGPEQLIPPGSVPAWPRPDRFRPRAGSAWPDRGSGRTDGDTNPWGAALAAGRIPPDDDPPGQPERLEEIGAPVHTAPFSPPSFDDDGDGDGPDLEPDAGPDPEADREPDRNPAVEPDRQPRRRASAGAGPSGRTGQ